MTHHLRRCAAVLAPIAAALLPGHAIAGSGPQSPFATRAIDEQALARVAGRADTQQAATAEQTAGVSRNSVGDNVHTGNATISGNAFENLSGLSILNVNTGNNVAINAAMNVNIALKPAP